MPKELTSSFSLHIEVQLDEIRTALIQQADSSNREKKPMMPNLLWHSWLIPRLGFMQFESEGGVEILERDETDTREQKKDLICSTCKRKITTFGMRIPVNGTHEHVFFNPHGFVFELGCFSSAPGCLPFGRTSMEFSWFAGHSWQIALCAGCQNHLGWIFQASDGDRFFGLILPRLKESGD
ncbi:MAG: cereblon family protein [Desulfovibrionales bacterium]